MAEITIKCPVTVCTQTTHETKSHGNKLRMRLSHMVINVLRKPVLIGPIESDIVKVRDMSERATKNKVYFSGYKT